MMGEHCHNLFLLLFFGLYSRMRAVVCSTWDTNVRDNDVNGHHLYNGNVNTCEYRLVMERTNSDEGDTSSSSSENEGKISYREHEGPCCQPMLKVPPSSPVLASKSAAGKKVN